MEIIFFFLSDNLTLWTAPNPRFVMYSVGDLQRLLWPLVYGVSGGDLKNDSTTIIVHFSKAVFKNIVQNQKDQSILLYAHRDRLCDRSAQLNHLTSYVYKYAPKLNIPQKMLYLERDIWFSFSGIRNILKTSFEQWLIFGSFILLSQTIIKFTDTILESV